MAQSTKENTAFTAQDLSEEFFELNDPSTASLKDKSLPNFWFKPSPMPEPTFMPAHSSFFLAPAETEKLIKAQIRFLKEKLKLRIHRE